MSNASYATLNAPKIYPAFFQGLENDATKPWAEGVARRTTSSAASNIYGFLDSVPEPLEGNGDLNVVESLARRITVVNKTWRRGLTIHREEAERDETGSWLDRVGEMGQVFSQFHWAQIIGLMNSGATAGFTSYDGLTFFNTAHTISNSGTNNNNVAAAQVSELTVVDANAPTPEEVAPAITGVIGHLMGFTDSEGRPMNLNANRFLVVTNARMHASFKTAIAANNLEGGATNPLAAAGYSLMLASDPRWTDDDAFAVFRMDSASRMPFFIQEEKPVELSVLGPGDSYYVLNDRILVKNYWRGAFAYGEPLSAVKATFST